MSAASNYANDKATLIPLSKASFGGVAAAGVAIVVFASATYAIRSKLMSPHAKARAVVHEPSLLTPALWHEPEVPPATTTSVVRVVPSDRCRDATAALCARRSKRDAAVAQAGATKFDVTSIATFLRALPALPKQGKRARANTPAVLAVATLDADGIAAAAPAPDAVSVGPHAVAAKDGPTDASLAFATALGQIKTGAQAGVMNGQPAGSLNIGLTHGPVVIDATGMSEVTNLSEPGVFRKTFKLSTRASIPFD